MQYTGYVRQIDAAGRIVVPMDLRNRLGLSEKDSVEFLIEGNALLLRKYQPCCIFCGSYENVVSFKGKNVCGDCAGRIKAITEE